SSLLFNFFFFFFFFQAEDGIRDLYVTGVQTCALPIFSRCGAARSSAWAMAIPTAMPPGRRLPARSSTGSHRSSCVRMPAPAPCRSEERRVGKEWRERWGGWHEKRGKGGGRRKDWRGQR